MNCCSGVDRIFDEKKARKDSESYWKKGPDKRVRQLVGLLKGEGLSGARLLEIGCGVGALHLEMLKEGAERAVGVEAAPAYIEAAQTLAQRLSLQDAVEYRIADFAQVEGDIASADIVLLDRVICCYPDVTALVTASARHAQRLCAMTYPRHTWWWRAGAFTFNLTLMRLSRNPFRIFVHHPDQVRAILASEQFDRVSLAKSGLWEIAIYRRQ